MQTITIPTTTGACTLAPTESADRFHLIGTYGQCQEIVADMPCVEIDELEATGDGCILEARIVREFFPQAFEAAK